MESCVIISLLYRGIVQSVEHQSPKLGVVGSSPPAPAKEKAHRLMRWAFSFLWRDKRCEKPCSEAAWGRWPVLLESAAVAARPSFKQTRRGCVTGPPAPARATTNFDRNSSFSSYIRLAANDMLKRVIFASQVICASRVIRRETVEILTDL